MYFKTNPRDAIDINIKIDDTSLDQKHFIKFLGVCMDDKLTWNFHFDNITSSISRAIGILY